ncbi:MAG: glycosyltransferase family 2 protein [Candidatus Limisoma sp.]
MKPIGVIILNWNGAELLRRYLPSVVSNNDDRLADVVVVDNGSTDASVEIVRNEFPSVKLLQFSENYGYAEGYNRALEQLDYQYSVLLNSDVAVGEGWLQPLYDYMEANSEVAACQPKILSDTDRTKFEYAGACGGFLDKHGYPYCRGRIFDTVETDNHQYDKPIEVFWATGAALFVRTEIYLNVGGLDKDFFAHMEEIDLCWRIHRKGYSIRVVPQSTVYHLGGGSLPASNPRKTYLNFRNNLFLLYKNLPVRRGRWVLLTRRLYDTLAWAMFVVKMDFANARAVIDAHRDFSRQRHRYDGTQPFRSIECDFACFRKNIITAYYLRRKKTYDKL